jgi:hypothetical protein
VTLGSKKGPWKFAPCGHVPHRKYNKVKKVVWECMKQTTIIEENIGNDQDLDVFYTPPKSLDHNFCNESPNHNLCDGNVDARCYWQSLPKHKSKEWKLDKIINLHNTILDQLLSNLWPYLIHGHSQEGLMRSTPHLQNRST